MTEKELAEVKRDIAVLQESKNTMAANNETLHAAFTAEVSRLMGDVIQRMADIHKEMKDRDVEAAKREARFHEEMKERDVEAAKREARFHEEMKERDVEASRRETRMLTRFAGLMAIGFTALGLFLGRPQPAPPPMPAPSPVTINALPFMAQPAAPLAGNARPAPGGEAVPSRQ